MSNSSSKYSARDDSNRMNKNRSGGDHDKPSVKELIESIRGKINRTLRKKAKKNLNNPKL